jgi:hypothetical protein
MAKNIDKDAAVARFKKRSKFLLIKLPIILGIILAILAGALKMVERHPDPLREGFEQYLSDATNTNAKIGVLNKISFIPNFNIDLTNLTLHSRSNAAITKMEAEQIKLILPLSALLLNSGKLKNVEILNMRMSSGLFTPKELNIDHAYITENPTTAPYFQASGTYNDKDLEFKAKIEKHKGHYRVPKEVEFTLQIGAMTLEAFLDKGLTQVDLTKTVYSNDGKVSTPQDYPLIRSKEYIKDNPLSCMIENADEATCNSYLE